MGKTFYFGGAWDKSSTQRDMYVDLQLQLKDEHNERYPRFDEIPVEQRPIIDPRTGEQARHPITGELRSRPVRPDAALGLDSDQYHYAGDRIVTINEEREIKGGQWTGRILHHFQRVDDNGQSLGTYEQVWEKVKDGRMRTAGKARKYYSL